MIEIVDVSVSYDIGNVFARVRGDVTILKLNIFQFRGGVLNGDWWKDIGLMICEWNWWILVFCDQWLMISDQWLLLIDDKWMVIEYWKMISVDWRLVIYN